MKVVAQRVLEASVKVDGKVVGKCDNGLMILVSFTDGDDQNTIDYMINKIVNLRIFNDEKGVMNLSIKDVGGSILSISQFTLYADVTKGNRPSYISAMKSEEASRLYDIFNEKLKKLVKVETGIFASHMEVSLINDGPVTIIIEK